MPTSHLRPTVTSSTVISGWRRTTGNSATTHEPVDFKLKLTSTTLSVVETDRRTPQQWECLVQGTGCLPTLSVSLASEGQTTLHSRRIGQPPRLLGDRCRGNPSAAAPTITVMSNWSELKTAEGSRMESKPE
jgi:hypothetical protein